MHLRFVSKQRGNEIAKFPFHVTGERGLLWAVIERAVNDALGLGLLGEYDKRGTSIKAQMWLRSREITPFSFYWCCSYLQVEPKNILRWMDKQRKLLL